MTTTKPIIEARHLNLFYGSFQALIDIDLAIQDRKITALIGPSGCGKSTLVRVFNRMNDLIEGVRVEGRVMIEDENIFSHEMDLIRLRKKVGMVFQRPNPFPLSVFDNITFGLQVHREGSTKDYPGIVEQSLRNVLLWDDLKDKLRSSALKLSLEQQQRLCIARVLTMKPKIILMDEPASALDPIATLRIEELMQELKKECSKRHEPATTRRFCIWASSWNSAKQSRYSPLLQKRRQRNISRDDSVRTRIEGKNTYGTTFSTRNRKPEDDAHQDGKRRRRERDSGSPRRCRAKH
jgi:phosphate transport system ATP-binding protein